MSLYLASAFIIIKEMETEEYFHYDSWLRFLLSQDFPQDFHQQESRQCRDSIDFLPILKKPKAEIFDLPHEDQENERDWPVIRKNIGPCAPSRLLPNLEKSSKAQIVQDTKVKVHFLGLKKGYEKVQSRVNRQSRQRLTDSKVRIAVTADAQITQVNVYVERAPMAAALSGDTTGRVPLKVKMGAQVANKQNLSVDLDSVYMSSQGTPVYKLSTVDADRRNRFRLVVTAYFIDGRGCRSFVSPTFLLRSRRPERKTSC